ncbi:MAG TPA: Ldh family oxidoreductase [Caldilineaceae bacterium]|nr:Ldh family oxidoreductase [Caldilineaceae bacterium]
MNTPPENFVTVDETRLLNFAIACFEKVGLSHEHAAIISRLLVNSDLRGVRSHGSRTVNGYTQSFADGKLNPQPNIQLVHETPTAVVIEGDGTLGYWPMVQATEHAIAKAKEVGIGMGLVRYIGHYGSAGHYARMCMDAGCIGFSVQGYRNQGVPATDGGGPNPGAHLGYYGNPPICFAIPGGEEPPVVLDAATCILADNQRGPEFEALFSMIPAAFFKSIGYGAVATLMGGALTGFTLSDESWNRWPAARMGGMVLAIDIASVVPMELFAAESDRQARDVASHYRPMPGYDRSLLPGAIEEEIREKHQGEGIRYGEMEQGNLRAASERLDVPLPWD